ncbi:MAG TPA: ribosome maturation factor RimM [Acidobacteriota bacterium]|nr:ribosome maturation factor RimM [Acidobacteriota bacterium]
MAGHFVPLGEIVATHGLDGWLKFNPFNPNSETLTPGLEVCLEQSGSRSSSQIESIKPHKKQVLIKLRDVDHIDVAQPYVGSTLLVDETALGILKNGQYYQYQVIGFAVIDLHGASVGTVTAIMSTPGGELYVVGGRDKEYLIPAVREIIERVDFDERKIVINPPDGLLDL